MVHDLESLYVDPTIFDILYTPGTAAEVDVLERIEAWWAEKQGRIPAPNRVWCEPACGTGRYLRVAASRGRRILGYDREPRLIAYALRRLESWLPEAGGVAGKCMVVADMITLRIPRWPRASVDFAFNPVNTIRHLNSDRAMRDHLAQVARLLKPGSAYLVGLSLTDYRHTEHEEDLWQGRRGQCQVSQIVNYLPPVPTSPRRRIEQVISHLTVTRPRGDEHFDDTYDLRCYDRGQWKRLLASSAMRLVATFNARGRQHRESPLPYQLDLLTPRD